MVQHKKSLEGVIPMNDARCKIHTTEEKQQTK